MSDGLNDLPKKRLFEMVDYTWDGNIGTWKVFPNIHSGGEHITVEYTSSAPSPWARFRWWIERKMGLR